MIKCGYNNCDKEAIITVGKEQLPLCEEHYIKYLKGMRKLLGKIEELEGKSG